MKLNKIRFLSFTFLFLIVQQKILFSQDRSIARTWNEVILESIRNDFARPTRFMVIEIHVNFTFIALNPFGVSSTS